MSQTPPTDLFAAHLETVLQGTAEALEACRAAGQDYRGLLLHSGSDRLYHADDQEVPFRSVPHFRRLAPLPGPGHLLAWAPGDERPTLFACLPRDFWHAPPSLPPHPAWELLQVVEVAGAGELKEAVGARSGWAYLGDSPELAEALGIEPEAVEPERLLAELDWRRAVKTPYELSCLRGAAEVAAPGHAAVAAGFHRQDTERALHLAYLSASGQLEHECPYGNIIAWDRGGAVLHYQTKRSERPAPGHTLLIDAGGQCQGYASDVTRTYVSDAAPEPFRELHRRLLALQEELVQAVRPATPFGELHHRSTEAIGQALCDLGVLRCGLDRALEQKLVWPFYPHGLGHFLGLQVHDVGGRQRDPAGGLQPPPEAYPHLRTTRTLEAGHVVTIEPGVYFIPLLLDPLREDAEKGDAFDWALVDALIPCGGIRMEDDVHVTDAGVENLTRPLIPARA